MSRYQWLALVRPSGKPNAPWHALGRFESFTEAARWVADVRGDYMRYATRPDRELTVTVADVQLRRVRRDTHEPA